MFLEIKNAWWQCLAIEVQVPMCSLRCSEAAAHRQLECKVLVHLLDSEWQSLMKNRVVWDCCCYISKINTKLKTSAILSRKLQSTEWWSNTYWLIKYDYYCAETWSHFRCLRHKQARIRWWFQTSRQTTHSTKVLQRSGGIGHSTCGHRKNLEDTIKIRLRN